jgi:hypothetical protein
MIEARGNEVVSYRRQDLQAETTLQGRWMNVGMMEDLEVNKTLGWAVPHECEF